MVARRSGSRTRGSERSAFRLQCRPSPLSALPGTPLWQAFEPNQFQPRKRFDEESTPGRLSVP